ncbi:uncharacterized protein LOC121761256 [Salvia splendens]|uniref:uncharacterized protein LOC121761256 n=1 Tax=Salvia splendens TaxID=180675 RepID=UPI001C269E52|nr:uncharacterized protein LOC121761256 [Salvia splendens]
MKGARPGRKRKAPAQQTHPTQDNPLRSRCPTRRSSTAPVFFPISPRSITPSLVLRPALRVLRQPESPVSPDPLSQHTTDTNGLCATNTSQVEVPQQGLDGHFQPLPDMLAVLQKSKTHDAPSSISCLNSTEYSTAHEENAEEVKAEIADISSESNVNSSQLVGDCHFQLPWKTATGPEDDADKIEVSEKNVVPPQSGVDGQFQPPGVVVVPHGEHMLEKCKTYDGPSTNNHCVSASHSLNLTEFAKRPKDDDDEDEVESALCIRGHKVKPEIAALVGAIFDKYGDITAESRVKSPSIIVSLFLERLCNVYQRLEQRKLAEITHAEINEMLDELYHYENQKFNVRWLLEKVERIYEANRDAEKYLLVKEKAAKCREANERIEEVIEMNERHVALIQKKIAAAKREKEGNEAKAKECTKMAMDIRAGIKALAAQSLVQGLL